MATIPTCAEQSLLTNIKDVIQVTVLVAGSVFGGMQLWAHSKNRRLQSLLAVLEQLRDEVVNRARWFAYEHHAEINDILERKTFMNEFERLRELDQFIRNQSGSQLDLQKYRHGLRTINMIAFLIRRGYVHRSVVPEYPATTLLRSHEYFRGWIRYRRTIGRIPLRILDEKPAETRKPSLYCQHLEGLAASIERGGHLKINRIVRVHALMDAIDQFGSARVGRDALQRIDELERSFEEMQRNAANPQKSSAALPS